MGVGMDRYIQWAVAMLQALDRAQPDAPAEDHELHARREEFRASVGQLLSEARGPLTVGVVGEFSAGKSLLIETMLGLPGLLSVSDIATTGNVTSIHVEQCAEGERLSSLGGRAVVYCTVDEITELMTYLHGRLVAQAPSEALSARQLEELEAARPEQGGWAPLHAWGTRYGGALGAGTMRSIWDEVRSLHTAYERGAWLLGQRYDVSEAQAKRAMSLPKVKLGESAPNPAGQAFEAPGNTVPDEVLAACVPLVRRVELRVRVPRAVWDLEGVGPLVLKDFPGVNSRRSGERDGFLSRRELRDIHAVLVLMNAQRGSVASEQGFFDMLREPTPDGRARRSDEALQEGLLVAVGRFDQLPVPDRASLESALPDGPEPLDERWLLGLQSTSAFEEVITSAHQLLPAGHRRQLVLVSAMLGLDKLAQSGDVRVDEALRARLGSSGSSGEDRWETAKLWGRVAGRLKAGDPGGQSLARALSEFALDGGLGLLRTELAEHARKRGGRLRLEAVERRAEVVDRMRLELARAEQAAHPEATYPPEYQQMQHALDATRRLLGDLRDSLVLGLGPGADGSDDMLRRRLADEAAALVSGWPQWKELFAAVDPEKQVVTVRQAARTEEDRAFDDGVEKVLAEMGLIGDDEEDLSMDPGSTVPGDPADLLPPFRATHAALLGLVHDDVRTGYEQRLDHHVHAMQELNDRWRGIAREQTRSPLTRAHRKRLGELILTTSVDELRDRLRQAPSVPTDPADVDAAYPLRLDRCFPWHVDAPGQRVQTERHVVHAVRIRRELVAALLYLVHGQLAKEKSQLAATAEEVIVRRERTVNASDTLDLLLSVFRADEEARRSAPLDLAAGLESMPAPGPRRGGPQTGTTRPGA